MTIVIVKDYSNRKTDWGFTAVISLLSLIIALPFAAFAQDSAQDGKANTAAPKIALEEREHNFGKVKEGEEVSHTFNIASSEGANNMADKSVLDFTLKNIDGKETKLSDYRGKVLLLVNVASQCGYTPQYEGLQAIYAKYRDQGLVVMGFPANNFGGQEPGTNEEIKQFCTLKYKVSFPMFAKISVKGADIHPLYKFLTSKETDPEFGGDISWNFNKFLIDRNGKIIARFETREKPEGEKVTQAIEKALK